MKTVTRPVYYCEHCGRHRLTASAIAKHEPRCIYNPDRSACGWHTSDPSYRPPRPSAFTERLGATLDLDELRRWADGCPACMLAVVVQADLDLHARDDLGFRYEDEVSRFRADERAAAALDVW